MVATLSYSPYIQTNAQGSFQTSSVGYIQGMALPDPALRNELAGGILASTETLPMWGGVGISEVVGGLVTVPKGPAGVLGSVLSRATTIAAHTTGQLTGFSVFDQAHSMINTPQSPVPLSGSGALVNFFRLGSGIRIPVAAAPSLVSLEGGLVTAQVSWDNVNQQLVPYAAAFPATTITGATWASTSSGQITYTVSSDLTADLSASDYITATGIVSTGATTTGYNGTYVVVSVSSTQIVVTAPRAASPGTYGSGGSVTAGGGALAVRVLGIEVGNSMTVSFDPTTGFATWNRAGTTAVILL